MDFNTFLNQAWQDHENDGEGVARRLPECVPLLSSEDDIPKLANLAGHVFGEHLGHWEAGIAFVSGLRQHPLYATAGESEKALSRTIASLRLASGATVDEVRNYPVSEQVRVLAVASSALAGQGQTERAKTLFLDAVAGADRGLAAGDPANRALAVTGNNLACTLEEKSSRTPADVDLMLLAARTARKYWEIAGTWLETERAEYRLAMTCIKAGDPDQAAEHARLCLDIIRANDGEALESFFACEALALAEDARGHAASAAAAVAGARESYEKLSGDDQAWCKDTLDRLSRLAQ